jgi:uncharacterized membrane protein YagU involved in acid resistance
VYKFVQWSGAFPELVIKGWPCSVPSRTVKRGSLNPPRGVVTKDEVHVDRAAHQGLASPRMVGLRHRRSPRH